MYVKGRELIIPSISTNKVCNSSNPIVARPITFLEQRLTDLTSLSQVPPYHASNRTLNCHEMPLLNI